MSASRAERVADQLRRSLARLLQEQVRDPRVGLVTLTEVRLSPDLRHARVFVTVLGADRRAALDTLERAAPFLRRSLAREAGLRFTPELRFVYDETVEGGLRIERLLSDLRADRPPEDDEETPDR